MKMVEVIGVAALLAARAYGDYDPLDPGIISLYKLDEATSGQLNNSVDQSFADTAPTGTPQPHDDLDDGTSDGPAWGGGSAFEVGGVDVGTGGGLIFTRSDSDNTRIEGWMSVSQGNYDNGDSFTIMIRLHPTETTDNTDYYVFANGSSEYIRYQGGSGDQQARVDVRLRDGGGAGGETYWDFTTHGDGEAGSPFYMANALWQNLFLIYDADTSLTIAVDDGTSFLYLTDTTVPADFSTLSDGFSDAGRHWAIGAPFYGAAPIANTFDGRIESIVIWDKALTTAEADAIDVVNAPLPGSLLLILGGLCGWFFAGSRRHPGKG